MKNKRCYHCGSRVSGPECPNCDHEVDFLEMDMRVVDYLRLLGLLFMALLRQIPGVDTRSLKGPGSRHDRGHGTPSGNGRRTRQPC